MPSLQQLEEFASSFKNIGDEVANTPDYEDFPLPETEPPEPFPAGISGEAFAGPAPDSPDETGKSASTDGGEDAPAETGGGFDIDDLFGGMASDLAGGSANLPDINPDALEMPAEESAAGTDEALPDISFPSDDDTGAAGGLGDLDFDDSFSGEDEKTAPEAGTNETIDLDNLGLPEFNAGEDEEPAATSAEDAGSEDADSTEETGGLGDLGLNDLGDFAPKDGEETTPPEEVPLDVSSLLDEVGGEGEASAEPAGSGETLAGEAPGGEALAGENPPGEDMPAGETVTGFENITGLEGAQTPAEAGDAFDGFSVESGASPEGADSTELSDDLSGPDFSIDSLDTRFGGTKASAKSGAAAGGVEEVEEIQLSENDFRRLQETLSGYPLNLRIACEEIIAEQIVDPRLMSALVKLLVQGAPAKETASLAGKILGRTIPVPKGAAKQTGADFEAEQASFGYIFVRKFLPVLRVFILAAMALFVTGYLCWHFIINPVIADGIYKDGHERILAGDYNRANDLFIRAFERHRKKDWFYRYAEAFRDMRQYQFAERKYDELLRVYPKDKKGALDYASMETNYLKNYQKADQIIRNNILDYKLDDRDGLSALGENNLAWGEEEPSRYEEARAVYSRLIERYGRQDPFLEGMLKYFIRTDKLNEVLPLQAHFMGNPKKRKITVPTLAELGGYLLDKKFEDVRGVPDEYANKIEGIRDILLRAIKDNPNYPESYYHLARYYDHYDSKKEERATLEGAIKVFDAAPEGTPKRAAYNVDIHRLYAEVLIEAGEFFPAAEQLGRGVRLYEDARTRNVLKSDPLFGRLYADLGDLAFFTQNGDMEAALRYYRTAETTGWSPPEVQYRMGVAHYELGQYEEALERFFAVSTTAPNNRRLLYALGNTAYLRGDYFAAQDYYNRLMDILESGKVRFPTIEPGGRPEGQDLAERIMVAENNLGVTLEALTRVSGNQRYRSSALGLFAESTRAWDVLTRNPETMTRMRPIPDLYGPGISLPYLNERNILSPAPGYDQQIFMRLDRDMPEPSDWENLVPRDYRLSDNLYMSTE